MIRWQEIIHLVNDRESWADKTVTSRLTETIYLGDKDPRGRQRKVKKGGNLWCQNVSFPSLRSHYNIIRLTDKKFPSFIDALIHLTQTR